MLGGVKQPSRCHMRTLFWRSKAAFRERIAPWEQLVQNGRRQSWQCIEQVFHVAAGVQAVFFGTCWIVAIVIRQKPCNYQRRIGCAPILHMAPSEDLKRRTSFPLAQGERSSRSLAFHVLY